MIRTRDFLLYMCTLVFLVSAIGYTVASDLAGAKQDVAPELAFAPEEQTASAYGAVAQNDDDSRAAYLARMREKLANGAGVIEGAPIVFTSVDETPEPDPVVGGSTGVLYCDVPADVSGVIAGWNPSSVEIHTVEGAYLVLNGSATLLQLPSASVRNAHDTCLSHEIAGIALDGSLMHNSDVALYASAGGGALLGYALDGFPIYGAVDPSTLDACGGADNGTGYRYHIRPGSNAIISCFAGTPASFLQ